MKVQRVFAIARKEYLHLLRDSRSLALAIAMPVLLLFLFGFALTFDLDRVPLVVWDQSKGTMSRDLVDVFRASRYFELLGYLENYAELERTIDRGDAILALVIPATYDRTVGKGERTFVQMIADGSDSNTATIALGYAEAVVDRYGRNLLLERVMRQTGNELLPRVELKPRAWFNEELRSKDYIVPALIAVILMIIAALLTSLTVAREWETGTMEALLSTPVQSSEIIIGKLLPYFALGMVDVILATGMGRYVFGVPFRGSLVLLFFTVAVFLVAALAMGMVISIVARSQLLANQLAMITTFIPAFLLSGLVFPIANMPRPIQLITYLIPARYLVSVLRALYLKGVGLEVLWPQTLMLSIFALAMIVLANVKFQKRLA